MGAAIVPILQLGLEAQELSQLPKASQEVMELEFEPRQSGSSPLYPVEISKISLLQAGGSLPPCPWPTVP